MSKQLNEVISENLNLFLGREEEIRAFILKHYEQYFEDHPIKNFERIDATDKIKTAGFQENLTIWRNIYRNIIVSSCIVEKGIKKRYDYKFCFIEEKLDDDKIEVIEAVLKDVNSLRGNLKFTEAIEKVDELLELIKGEGDRVFNKRLFDVRKEILTAEKEFNYLNNKLIDLEESLELNQKGKIKESDIRKFEEILEITNSLNKIDLTNKYSKLLLNTKKELEFQNSIKKLENEFEFYNQELDFDKMISISNDIIQLSKEKKKEYYISKFTKILKAIDQKVENIKEKVQNTLKEGSKLKDDNEFEKALIKIDEILQVLQDRNYRGFNEYKKLLQDQRNEVISAQIFFLKKSDNLIELNKKFVEALKENKDFLSLIYCERLIELSEKMKKPIFIDRYTQAYSLIQERIEELKKQIEETLNISTTLSEDLQFEEALSRIDAMIKKLGQNLPNYRVRMERKRKEIITAQETYRKLEDQIFDLDKELFDEMEQKNYINSLRICEKIVNIAKKSQNPIFIEKYDKIFEEINQKIKEIKEKIDRLIEESLLLNNEKCFKEALSKLDYVVEIIGNQELTEYKRKQDRARIKIIRAQEDYVQSIEDLTELDKILNEDLENNNLVAALNGCDLLIQIAESYNNPKLIESYMEIYDQINERILEIKQKIGYVLDNSKEQVISFQFDEAISDINYLLGFIKDKEFPDYEIKLEERKKEIVEAKEKNKIITKQIEDLEHKVQKSITNNKLNAALADCQTILKLSKSNKMADRTKKYSKQMKILSNKIKEIEMKVEKTIEDSSDLSNKLDYDGAISKLDGLLESLEQYDNPDLKKKIKEKKKLILETKEFDAKEAEIKKIRDSTLERPMEEKNSVKTKSKDKSKKDSMDTQLYLARMSEELSFLFDNLIGKLNGDLNVYFELLKKRISVNLKKLQLGVIHRTTMTVIDAIIEDEIEKFMEQFKLKIEGIRIVFEDGLKDISENIGKK